MKALFGSHFEFEKFHSWTICHSNILGKKSNGNVMMLNKVGSKTTIFTVFVPFEPNLKNIELKSPEINEKTCFWPNYAELHNIPIRFFAQNIWMTDSSRVKLSKLELWTKKGFHLFLGHILPYKSFSLFGNVLTFSVEYGSARNSYDCVSILECKSSLPL